MLSALFVVKGLQSLFLGVSGSLRENLFFIRAAHPNSSGIILLAPIACFQIPKSEIPRIQGRANRPGEPLFPLPLRASARGHLLHPVNPIQKFLSPARLRLRTPSSQRNPSFVPWCLREKTSFYSTSQSAKYHPNSESTPNPYDPIPAKCNASIKVGTGKEEILYRFSAINSSTVRPDARIRLRKVPLATIL